MTRLARRCEGLLALVHAERAGACATLRLDGMKVTQEKCSTEAVNSGVGWVGPDSKEEKMLVLWRAPKRAVTA